MPILKDTRKKIEVSLPSGGQVTVLDGMLAGDIDRINQEKSKNGAVGISIILSLIINDWDFTDEEGKKLLVTAENIARLNALDIEAITKAVNFTDSFLAQSPSS